MFAQSFGVNSIFSYVLAGTLSTFIFYSDKLWGWIKQTIYGQFGRFRNTFKIVITSICNYLCIDYMDSHIIFI